MDKVLFEQLKASVEQADDIIKGDSTPARITPFSDLEVKAIRNRTGLTQQGFANIIGVSRRTLENWEQGRRRPTGPARALLKIFHVDPIGAVKALQSPITSIDS